MDPVYCMPTTGQEPRVNQLDFFSDSHGALSVTFKFPTSSMESALVAPAWLGHPGATASSAYTLTRWTTTSGFTRWTTATVATLSSV